MHASGTTGDSLQTVSPHNVTLTDCDREAVAYPHAIQAHGVLCVLEESESALCIRYVSANVERLLGIQAHALIGQTIDALLDNKTAQELRLHISRQPLSGPPVHLLRYVPLAQAPLGARSLAFDVFAHRHAGHLILELELATENGTPEPRDLYGIVGSCTSHLQAARSMQEFFDIAVEQVRQLTGFERVHVYQFLDDNSGVIRAESKRNELPSYLDLHFPATDVPMPARRLLRQLWSRHLPDTAYEPQPLLPDAPTDQPLDLSLAMLRSTSKMCNRFYQNMGVRATLMLTLLKEGDLWGFIGCHHGEPRFVPHEVRLACESLSHMVSMLLAAKEQAEAATQALACKAEVEKLIAGMGCEEVFQLGLLQRKPSLLQAFDARGAALVAGQEMTLIGVTPTEPQIRTLLPWLNAQPAIVVTDCLPQAVPEASEFSTVASGLLAIRLLGDTGYILCFRPEQIEEILWAGNPEKPVELEETGEARLGPRRSFALWKEKVAGRSRPWKAYQKDAAGLLHQAVCAFQKSEDLALLNASLQHDNQALANSNVDLEAFAYTAAHDLKEPLRGIRWYCTFLKDSAGQSLTDEQQGRLETIVRLSQRMQYLVDGLLTYSRLGQGQVERVMTDLRAVVNKSLEHLQAQLRTAKVEVMVSPTLPTLACDPARVEVLLTNIISNAIKYNEAPSKRVEIGVIDTDPPAVYVRDNGIGVAPEHHETIFKLFQRLHGRSDYGGGTGAGLTIAQKIAERHGGRLWVESSPGQGSTFYFTLTPATAKQ